MPLNVLVPEKRNDAGRRGGNVEKREKAWSVFCVCNLETVPGG